MAAVETMAPAATETRPNTTQTSSSFNFDSSYAGNTGNDLGISTAGYRTGKFNTQEWQTTNYNMAFGAVKDREAAGKVCKDTPVLFIFTVHFAIPLCEHTLSRFRNLATLLTF